MKLEIQRFGHGMRPRFWAVICDGELLCVTLYRKGAQAVVNKLEALKAERPAA